MGMRVWVVKDHNSHYPVGAASVIVAENEKQAYNLLDAALIADGLKPHIKDPYTLIELSLDTPQAMILVNGDY
jgi:hypothetical protein